MDIKVLKYFLAVAREGSITRAAECLHMTQPPLSRQMKDLEEETGVQLFKRASKRLTLTPEGLLLRKRAEEMVELFEKTKLELNQYGDNPSGDVYRGRGKHELFLNRGGCAVFAGKIPSYKISSFKRRRRIYNRKPG